MATSTLTEAQIGTIRRLAAAGERQGVLASRFGVHRSTISRIVRGERHTLAATVTEPGPVTRALDAYLAELDVEVTGLRGVHAAVARNLAARADTLAASDAVAAGMAVARVAGQLTETLATLAPGEREADAAAAARVLRGLIS